MKQQLKRLKGTSLSTSVGEIVLKDYIRLQQSQYDQLYFTTNQQSILCKVYNITNDTSIQRYEHQKQIYQIDSYPSLAPCITKTGLSFRKINYAILVLDQIPKNSSINQLGSSLSFCELLQMTKIVLELIKELKIRNQVFLNIRPQNIVKSLQNKFVIINPEYICSKGNHSTLEQNNELFFSNVEKYFKYNSPEVLDNYTYFNIDSKSDLFSLGCILYEIIYGKYPFESKFANINIIYELQEGFFGKFIQKIFKPYKQRAEVEQLLAIIEAELKKNTSEPKQNLITSSVNVQSRNPKMTHSFLDDLSSVFNKYTKETEGSYLNFTQDNENFPQVKYLNMILTKLYKNPNKLQKLQSIISKHLKATQYNTHKNFIIKNMALIFLILRKNRNYMLQRWRQNIQQIKEVSKEKSQIHEFCDILQQKIQLQQEVNCILKGNFFLEDVCQFRLLKIPHLGKMIKYLQNMLNMSSKLLMYKQDDYLFHYLLDVVCDEVYDLVSMIIFSVIAIRKDNQLGLRKDSLSQLGPLEKALTVVLKKIGTLSNKVSSHAIYSIETDYYNYKQDIYLKENPQYTSFQYFIKHCNYYKGLAIPQTNNFSSTSQSENKADFSSFEAINTCVQKTTNTKFYGNEISSDEDEPQSSIKQIPKEDLNLNIKIQKDKNLISASKTIKNEKKALNNINNVNKLFGNDFLKPPQTLKKVKSQDKPLNIFSIQKKSGQNEKPSEKKVGFDDFSNFFLENTKKNQSQKKETTNSKSIESKSKPIQSKNSNEFFQNFSFFHNETKKNGPTKEDNSQKRLDLSNWVNFNQPPRNSIIPQQKQEKQGIKVDPSILKQDIFNYDWLKRTQQNPFSIFVHQKKTIQTLQPQTQKLSPFVGEIISSLKLKQLKDLILANKEVAIEFDKLVFEKVIGSGSAGEVYLGRYANQAVAIKKVKIRQNPNALKQFERQLVTYIKIKKNPYLVSLVGISKSNEDFYLLTEFCSAGSLFDLLHKKAAQIFLNWKTKISLILQIAKGMKALHDMKPPIIHRDLKSLNVFISQQNNEWIAKVADFGLSRSPEAQMMTMALGTLHWMAPQLLDNKQYSLKVDVYSFAVVMWQICARKTPYYDLSNPMAIMKYVTIDKKRPNMSIIDINCPGRLLQLIQRCWDEDPNKRPLFKEIIEILFQIDSGIIQ